MSAAPPNLGVAAPPPTPAATPAWPGAAQLTALPAAPPSVLAAWPRPALWATVLLLGLALLLLGWNAYGSSRWATRPTALQPDAILNARLDLNRADHAQLLQLPGVGEALATRVEAYREEHHGFRSVEELRQVHGVGPAILAKLRPYLYVEVSDETEESEVVAEPPRPVKRAGRKEPAPPNGGKMGAAKKTDALTERIDVNRATAEELQRLPGIGPTLAARIIARREQAPFKSADELRRVSGIGPKTLEKLRPHIQIDNADAAATAKKE